MFSRLFPGRNLSHTHTWSSPRNSRRSGSTYLRSCQCIRRCLCIVVTYRDRKGLASKPHQIQKKRYLIQQLTTITWITKTTLIIFFINANVFTQAVRFLSVSVALAVVAVPRVTGAHHSTKMISTLLLTGGASTHVIICINKIGIFSVQRQDRSCVSKAKCSNKCKTREGKVEIRATDFKEFHTEEKIINNNKLQRKETFPYLQGCTGQAQTWSRCNISSCEIIDIYPSYLKTAMKTVQCILLLYFLNYLLNPLLTKWKLTLFAI